MVLHTQYHEGLYTDSLAYRCTEGNHTVVSKDLRVYQGPSVDLYHVEQSGYQADEG